MCVCVCVCVCVCIYVCIIDADSSKQALIGRCQIPRVLFARRSENGMVGSRFLLALYCYSPKLLTPPQQQIAVSEPNAF